MINKMTRKPMDFRFHDEALDAVRQRMEFSGLTLFIWRKFWSDTADLVPGIRNYFWTRSSVG